jgi:chromosome segregation ATPase
MYVKNLLLAAAMLLIAPAAASAQDIAGIEDCTKTGGLDKRTGCFQSNVEFLHRSIAKQTGDAQQKLSAAYAEIGELRRAVAALQTNIATLQTALVKMQAAVDQLQPPAKKPDAKETK